MNRMWESFGPSYKDLGFKSWAQKKNAIAKAQKVKILENFLKLEKKVTTQICRAPNK